MNLSTINTPTQEGTTFYSDFENSHKDVKLELRLAVFVLLVSCYFVTYSLFGDCPFTVFSTELMQLASPKATLGFLASN